MQAARGAWQRQLPQQDPPPYGRSLATVRWLVGWPCRTPPRAWGPQGRRGEPKSGPPAHNPPSPPGSGTPALKDPVDLPDQIAALEGMRQQWGRGRRRALVATSLTWEMWKTGCIFREGGRVSRRAEGLITWAMV